MPCMLGQVMAEWIGSVLTKYTPQMQFSTVLAHQPSAAWSREWSILVCIVPWTWMRNQLLKRSRWRRNGSRVLGAISIPSRLAKHFDHLLELPLCACVQLSLMTVTNDSWMSTLLPTNTGLQRA